MKIKVIKLDRYDLRAGLINIGDEFEVINESDKEFTVKLDKHGCTYILNKKQCEIIEGVQ